MARLYNPDDSLGASYGSLSSMLRSPELLLGICMPGMIAQCDASHTAVSVRGRRVIISVRDSAQISELFGMRPSAVIWQKNGDSTQYESSVHYVEPFIAPPDSLFRTKRAAQVQAYEFSTRRLSRYITPRNPEMMVGDSMFFILAESSCRYDLCFAGPPRNAEWSVDDTTVVRIATGPMFDPARQRRRPGNPWRIFVTALTPGRAVLTARWDPSIVDSVAAPPSNPAQTVITVYRQPAK
jgi:hypothetical protein